MRILVCGGRNYAHRDRVFRELEKYYRLHGSNLVIIHGKCPTGADAYADEYCETKGVQCDPLPADWDKGSGAGHARNQQMIDRGRPDLVLAFPGGTGTHDMKQRAMRAGIKVKEVY